METAVRPYASRHEEGEKRFFLGAPSWIKATGEQSGGVLTVIEQIIPPGAGTPWHLHRNEDESLYIIDGELLFIVGTEQQRISAGPGAYVFGPRNIPHGFRNDGPTPVRLLLEYTPAGFERFVLAVSEPAPASAVTPTEPLDMDKVLAEAAKANIEILGPLPE